jgi:hypothetical protein
MLSSNLAVLESQVFDTVPFLRQNQPQDPTFSKIRREL